MRKFRNMDVELLSLRNLKSDAKLVLAEILSWDNYYKTQTSHRYYFNPAQVASSVGVNLIKTIRIITSLVDLGVLRVDEINGTCYISAAKDMETIIKILTNKNK